jgi:5-methylcytosine-specific restriction endonuclease McrA
MPIRLCADPSCGNVAVYRGRCRDHARRREQALNRSRAGFAIYRTRRWARTRARVLAEEPICAICENALSEHVHHVKDIGDGGDPWARENLQGCCAHCHGVITRKVG